MKIHVKTISTLEIWGHKSELRLAQLYLERCGYSQIGDLCVPTFSHLKGQVCLKGTKVLEDATTEH